MIAFKIWLTVPKISARGESKSMLPIFFVFGSRPRTTETGRGNFVCPHCQQERPYVQNKMQNYFTLYFVPLIPLGNGQEVVECLHCGHVFEPEVLNMNIKIKRKVRPLADQLNTLRQDLERGLAFEYAVADLTAAGLDRDIATENVIRMTGENLNICKTCGLHYIDTLNRCPDDDTVLLSQKS